MKILKLCPKYIIIGISSIIAITLVLIILFTGILGKPKLIYLDLIGDKRHVYFTSEIKDIDLRITGNYDYFLNNLKYCNNLKRVTYGKGYDDFGNLDFLADTKLDSLILFGTCNNWSPLSDCVSLTTLSISDSNIKDLSDIDDLKNLRTLELRTDKTIRLDGIEKLVQLKRLCIQEAEIDLAEIVGRVDLTSIWLISDKIKHLELLSQMGNLEEVHLYGNYIKLGQLSQLTNIKSLKKVILYDIRFDASESEVKKITDKLTENGVEVEMEDNEYAG